MNDLELAIIFLVLALMGIVVRKTYYYLPPREVKRRAGKGDKLAASLFKAVAYGNSLSVLLWLYIGLTSAAGLILMSRQSPVWISLLVVALLLWLAFSLVPSTRTTSLGIGLTRAVTPAVAWCLNYISPVLNRASQTIEGRYISGNHTKMFERSDLLQLVEKQKTQQDSRFSEAELDIIRRALTFDENKVRDVLTPKKIIKTILADDAIGPILIDEVHKSGQDYVLVREKARGQVIGTLAFNNLGIDSKGHVRDVMDKNVYYLNEDDSLRAALSAYFATSSPTFIVVNNAEEFVGIVTIENVIHHLVGDLFQEDFDNYTSAQAVATRHMKTKEEVEKSEELPETENTPVKTDEEVIE
jgi:CBS domain containing-hemolysin-like protein